MENNIFIKNNAIVGGAIKFNDKIIDVTNNIFKENEANLYGNDIATFPIRMEFLNKTKEMLQSNNQLSPGHYLNFSIDLCLVDHYSQVVSIDEK